MLRPPARLSHIRCALDMQYMSALTVQVMSALASIYARGHTSSCAGFCDSHDFLDCSQVKERKDTLAQYETLDNGKPISEAAWDMVRL